MSGLPLPAPAADALTAPRDLLRFITCGSVDDGKSTLLGRLLFESGHLFDDQLAALTRDSRRVGTQGGALDLALALDGLAAEREQGITIDVAYRYFSTPSRSFIAADTPGHEQYTRNMATGASTADTAILLIDIRRGITRQTRRHALLVSMLGIRQVCLAVNKMDLVGFAQAPFDAVLAEAKAFAAGLGLDVAGIPLSALTGDNVTSPSAAMPWYAGPPLLGWLETVETATTRDAGSFRLAVQGVSRPDSSFRGYTGIVAGGPAWPGQSITILPSGETSRIARIVTYDGDLDLAQPGEAVTITLADERDVSRGAVLSAGERPAVTDRASARLFWMAAQPLRIGASYLAKVGTQIVTARIEAIGSRVNFDSLARDEASALDANDVGDVTLAFDRAVVIEPYHRGPDLGALILIEPERFETVALGLVGDDLAQPEAETARSTAVSIAEGSAAGWLAVPFASISRSMLKTVTWRLLGTILTVAAAYLLTHDLGLALLLGGVEVLAKFALYFGHERLWARIGLGLRALPAAAARPDDPAERALCRAPR